MKYFLCIIGMFLTLPAWASGDYFAADRQAIVEGLTKEPVTRSRSFTPSKNVRAIRVSPVSGGTENIEVNVAELAPTVQMRIEFDSNSDVLRKFSLPLLRELGDALQDPLLMGKHIRIGGHTDGDGGDGYNLDLSLRRAASVAKWLTSYAAIDPQTLEIVGFGERVPLVKNSSAANKQKNRRVEISVQKSGFQKNVPELGTESSEGTSSGNMAW
ncbi:MAG: OmpA family protein [Desulfoplanes sp.]|nr:OmpA family protein [Desulfoplanes sp.]